MAILDDFAERENIGIAYPSTGVPPERMPGPPPALLSLLDAESADFTMMNSEGHAIPSGVIPRLTASEAETFDRSAREFFDLPTSDDDEWTAVVKFSSPAYDSEESALVYLEYVCSGPLCAGGIWYVLKPVRGEWIVTSRQVVWRS